MYMCNKHVKNIFSETGNYFLKLKIHYRNPHTVTYLLLSDLLTAKNWQHESSF